MVGWMLEASDPAAAARWKAGVAGLHAASQQGREAIQQASSVLIRQVDDTLAQLRDGRLSGPDAGRLFQRLKTDTLNASFNAYMTAEQVLMVMALLTEQLQGDSSELDGLYKSLSDQHRFRAEEFLRAASVKDGA